MSQESHPLVSVVIVNYSGADFLEPCLRSVLAQRYHPVEIIVVDNASSDQSVSLVREKFPDVRLICCERNLGFAGGNNKGVEEAKGEYVVLLNNDTVVEEGWLEPLLNYAMKPGIGAVTSCVMTDGVPESWYEMNGTINYLGYNIMREFADLSTVFFGSAASLMFRKSSVGVPFPDEFFLYHEDVFLSWRQRTMGRKIRMAQASIVRHKGSSTTKRQPSVMISFYQERNRLLNPLFFYERRTLFLLIPYFLVDAVGKIAGAIMTRRKSLLGIMKGYWWIGMHWRWILDRRRDIQAERTVPDREIMKLMSCKVLDTDSAAGSFVNAVSKLYVSITGLPHHG